MSSHSFHIPVMGIGFTIDSPLKVSKFGIDSVISLVDDSLIERLRKMYCEKYNLPYQEIDDKSEDFRAERIKTYLNLINELAEKKFEELKDITREKGNEFKEYMSLLPESSNLKDEFKKLSEKIPSRQEIKAWMNENLSMGSIDVNIMTKVDRDNYKDGEKLPVEYNDAHAALRGFAQSNLESSVILSAGLNPRLYSYMEQFEDFYPNKNGEIKKKIVLKVSDYKSAIIQGKFLAKKGLWVSEYRIESGLNCGGHAFATEGHLLGPILAEFRDRKEELIADVQDVLKRAFEGKQRELPLKPLGIKVTAQGGVGTAEEHDFLLDHYQVDSVGWGTPMMLVPEATTVDDATIDKLIAAKEDDLYLSDISPLGIPFNNMKGNTKDIEKQQKIDNGKPGSSCPKKYAALNKAFNDDSICTSSRKYQHLSIKALKEEELEPEDYKAKFNKIVTKSCTCVGLGTSALLKYNLDTKVEGEGVSVCPGPNMAYFDKKISLKEMIDHIYGRTNVIQRTDRPNMFIKELNIYIDYLRERIDEAKDNANRKQQKYLNNFGDNLKEGILYYQDMFEEAKGKFEEGKSNMMKDLEESKTTLRIMKEEFKAKYSL